MRKITLALILIISLGACKRKNELPAPTQGGENTFGMMLNDSLWLPKPHSGGIIFGRDYTSASLYYDNKTINIASEGSGYLYFNIKTNGNIGKYKVSNTFVGCNIKDSSCCSFRTRFERGNNCFNAYFLIDSTLSEVNITKLDTINKTVSGTFFMTLIDPQGKKIKISDGRFDLKLY